MKRIPLLALFLAIAVALLVNPGRGQNSATKTAVFAGGCFWCIQPAFDKATGVIKTDRKSTRLNSSHLGISYAVFCLKKKKKTKNIFQLQQLKHLWISINVYII